MRTHTHTHLILYGMYIIWLHKRTVKQAARIFSLCALVCFINLMSQACLVTLVILGYQHPHSGLPVTLALPQNSRSYSVFFFFYLEVYTEKKKV